MARKNHPDRNPTDTKAHANFQVRILIFVIVNIVITVCIIWQYYLMFVGNYR